MAPSIEVDEEVYALLTREARPFVETTPNAVLRRLLALDASGSSNGTAEAPASEPTRKTRSGRQGRRSRRRRSGQRAPAGSLLPEGEYEAPILRVLDERGGRAPTREVVEAVGEILKDRLTELDKAPLTSGDIRWENRVQFTRLRMIEQGLLSKDSPRGTWEISDKGRQALKS